MTEPLNLPELDEQAVDAAAEGPQPFLHSVTSKTPWCLFSIIVHVLVIALIGLLPLVLSASAPDQMQIDMIADPGRLSNGSLSNDVCSEDVDPFLSLIDTNPQTLIQELGIQHYQSNLDPEDGISLGLNDVHSNQNILGSIPVHETKVNIFGELQSTLNEEKSYGHFTGETHSVNSYSIISCSANPLHSARNLLLMKYTGSRVSGEAVEKGLNWLAYHQESDGHWASETFGSKSKQDIAVTALATLALLGNGNTEKSGRFRDNVKRSIAWLKNTIDSSYGTPNSDKLITSDNVGLVTLVFTEATKTCHIPDTRQFAQKFVIRCIEFMKAEGGPFPHPTCAEVSASGWRFMALRNALQLHFEISTACLDDCVTLYSPTSVLNDDPEQTKYRAKTQNCRQTATYIMMHLYMGGSREEITSSVDSMIESGGLPAWGERGNSIDFEHWVFASQCTFQIGGPLWKRWNKALVETLMAHQNTAGDDAGSWPVIGAFSDKWGRVGQTALGCLTLQTCYRYPKLPEPPAQLDSK